MQINVKRNNTILFDEFKFKCSLGKNGISSKKKEGDLKTPKGTYSILQLFYRKDKLKNIKTKLKKIIIKKNMFWCDDIKSKYYNKLVRSNKIGRCEKMLRRDNKYNLLIIINYNTQNTIKNKGSAIFIHLTENYKKTKGCIALKEKDMLILLKIINKKTKIKIF
jgi:L,D-peptidoglycan transpeptidase YkuD (ErfK/YbiS/YcfS/YnhG family)